MTSVIEFEADKFCTIEHKFLLILQSLNSSYNSYKITWAFRSEISIQLKYITEYETKANMSIHVIKGKTICYINILQVFNRKPKKYYSTSRTIYSKTGRC